MEIKEYISTSYVTVNSFDGVNIIDDKLIDNGYLVVFDDDMVYQGILTPCDIIQRPHKIVIDCLTEKEKVSIDESIISIFDKFVKNKCITLPVFDNQNFIGIIEKNNVIQCLTIKLNELYEKSLISEKLKISFLNNLSHEVRTPLNGLIGFVNLITELNPNDLRNEQFQDIIKRCSSRFLFIMNDLIELSLIDSGDKIKIENDYCIIEDVFLELKQLFEAESLFLNNKIELIYSNSNNSAILYLDMCKIKHILYHLIDNAIKFTIDGCVEFGFDIFKNDKSIKFFVKNNGNAINKIDEKKIFKAFEPHEINEYQLKSGLGIGLSLVKKYVEILGGNIGFEITGSQTIFNFSLPLTKEIK